MKALDFPLLADENVHPEVIDFLRKAGWEPDSLVLFIFALVTFAQILQSKRLMPFAIIPQTLHRRLSLLLSGHGTQLKYAYDNYN